MKGVPALSPTYTFRIERRPTINDGYLCCFGSANTDLYIPNGQRRRLRTEIDLHVPKGLTVLIQGTQSHLDQGITVAPQELVGPADVVDLHVLVHNGADATVSFTSGDPIARVRAVETPPVIRFRATLDSVVQEQPEQPERAPRPALLED